MRTLLSSGERWYDSSLTRLRYVCTVEARLGVRRQRTPENRSSMLPVGCAPTNGTCTVHCSEEANNFFKDSVLCGMWTHTVC